MGRGGGPLERNGHQAGDPARSADGAARSEAGRKASRRGFPAVLPLRRANPRSGCFRAGDPAGAGRKHRLEPDSQLPPLPRWHTADSVGAAAGIAAEAEKVVAEGVNKLRQKDRSFVMVTHYQRLLNYIVPDFVHVLIDGRIAKSGGKELAFRLEEKGYDWVNVDPEPAAKTS